MKETVNKAMILTSVILMDFLVGMEFDLFVPSFSVLQSHFSLSPFWVEALLSVNFLGYCLSIFFVGGLADRFGRKPIILMGLIIFIMGSVLCVWGGFYSFLLVGRFLQGIGVAAPAILSFLIIADTYPLKQQQFLMSMLNGSMNTAVAVAPIIGSYITLYFNWRGNFMVLLTLGLIVLIATIIFVPSYKLPEHKESTSFKQGYFSLFQSKPLLLLMANIICTFVPYWVFVGMSPLLYLKNLGVSLTHFGYYQGVLALVFATGSVLFGFIIHFYDQKKWLHLVSKLYTFSLLCILTITIINSRNALYITLAFLPFIISGIIPSNLLGPVCLNFIPQAKGRISAVLQGSRLIFAALSLQIAGYFYQGTFRNIGIIITFFMVLIMITHFLVIKNKEIMNFSQTK